MSETIVADDGVAIPVGDLPLSIARTATGKPDYMTIIYRGITYVQTYSYDAGDNCTAVTEWEAQ